MQGRGGLSDCWLGHWLPMVLAGECGSGSCYRRAKLDGDEMSGEGVRLPVQPQARQCIWSPAHVVVVLVCWARAFPGKRREV